MSRAKQTEQSRMDAAERKVAANSGTVFSRARMRHLAMGHDVVIARDDGIYRLSPDGGSELLSRVRPHHQVRRGTKIKLR